MSRTSPDNAPRRKRFPGRPAERQPTQPPTHEAPYRDLVQSANSIIYRRDTEGRIIFFNEFAQRFFGFTEAEILGRHVVGTIVPPTDSAGRDLAAMIADITVHPDRYIANENENMRRNGERVWVAWTNRAIRDESGRVVEVLCIGNDVTERKRSERLALAQRDLGMALALAGTTDDALRLCLEAAIVIGGMDCGAIYRMEEPGGDFVLTQAVGLSPRYMAEGARIPASDPRIRQVKEGRPFYFNAQVAHASPAVRAEGLRAVAVLPILHDGRAMACIAAASHTLDAMPPANRTAIETTAIQIGNAVARVQAKEALAAEVDIWQRTFDAIEYLVALIDADRRIIRANQAMRRAFPGRRIIGARCHELFHNAPSPISGCPSCTAFLTGGAAHAERREPALGNRYFDIYAYPVKELSGETVQVVHIACDITARKQAEEEREATIHLLRLVNSSTSLEALMKTATIFLREWSGCQSVGVRIRRGQRFPLYETRGFPATFTCVEEDFCCPAATTGATGCVCRKILFGQFDPAQPFYSQSGSFWTNEASEWFTAAGGKVVEEAFRHCCAKGYESIAAIPLRAGGETFGLLQFNDKARGRLTRERIALLERLADNLAIGLAQRRSEEDRVLLSSAVEQAAEAIVITDTSGIIQHVNPAFSRITGYRADEAVGRSFDFLRSDQQDPEFYRKLLEALRRGEVWTGRLASRRKDRTIFEEEATISPVRNPSGEIVRFVAVKRDVTREAALEAQFRHSQKMEAVGRLAGGVAHDFNNLLTAIIGFSDLILDRLEPKSPVRREVEQVKKAGERASSLVRQLLAFSRRQVLQPRLLDLNVVVADVEKMLRRLIGEDIELRIERGANLGMVRADPGQIEQVIMNLAVNARDAMPRGGRLTITTTCVNLDEAAARNHAGARPGPYVQLAVTDTGCGMNAEVLSHLFEPFFTTKETGKGTGLGLSTVYGIVTQSGGFVTVESRLGHGSSFRVHLPQMSAETAAACAAPQAAPSHRGTETILLVEDEEVVRNLARMVLQGHGYTVLTAAGAEDALNICARYREPIHLIVTDVVMPDIGGYDMVQRILPQRPGLKVLFISGYLDNAAIGQESLHKNFSFLAKPFAPEAFAAKVREVLGRKKVGGT